jgi:hypothetical protein
VVEALTGVKPKISRKSDGAMEVVCSWTHLEGFKRHAELAEAVERWPEEAGRRVSSLRRIKYIYIPL